MPVRTHRRPVRATLAVLVGALVALIGGAGPAAAHGRGSDATNFSSRVLGTPDLPGVTWRVIGGDEFLEVSNTSDVEVVVLGYEPVMPEPYLRVGPDGVFVNRNSEATYANQDRYQATPIPEFARENTEPEWQRVSDGTRYAWHDHRIHWMSPALPPEVADPAVQTVVYDRWGVPFRVGEGDYEVTGDLTWVPGGSAWPWVLGALVLVLPALAGLRTQPTGAREDGSPERWAGLARPAAAVLGAVTLVGTTQLADDLLASPLPTSAKLLAAAQTALFLLIAGFGAVRGWQAREGAFTALGVGAGALLVGQGLLYREVLSTSQTTSLFPGWVSRMVVALCIAQALPMAIVAVVGTRRLLPPIDDVEDEEVGAPSARTRGARTVEGVS